MVLVVVLSKVQQDGGALKDGEIITRAIGYCGDAAIGVEFDVPRLFLHILRKFNLDYSAICTTINADAHTLTGQSMELTRSQVHRIALAVPRGTC